MIAAAPELPEALRVVRESGPDSTGAYALVSMAVLAVLLLAVVWAVFIRKPGRGRRRERGRLTSAPPPAGSGGKSRRRRRRSERRNPTLAETGGLPPLREDGRPGTAGASEP
ncbi:MAG: hypothetical protein ACKOEQ_08150 [Verrucomicrobiota bacterium]